MASSCCSLSLSQRCLALTLNRLQFFSIRSQFNSFLPSGGNIVVLLRRARCALAHTERTLGPFHGHFHLRLASAVAEPPARRTAGGGFRAPAASPGAGAAAARLGGVRGRRHAGL